MKKRYIAIILSVLLVLIGITATFANTQKPAETVDNSTYEPLIENDLLNQSACAKARHMVDNNYWSHIAPDGTDPFKFIVEAGYTPYQKAGENLAYGYETSKTVVDGWVKSPKHEENLVYIYNDVGVCTLTNVMYQGGTNTVIVAHYGLQ